MVWSRQGRHSEYNKNANLLHTLGPSLSGCTGEISGWRGGWNDESWSVIHHMSTAR
jgi:hypothetical protein